MAPELASELARKRQYRLLLEQGLHVRLDTLTYSSEVYRYQHVVSDLIRWNYLLFRSPQRLED